VDTSGRRWSSERITTRPFGKVYFSNLIVGASLFAALATAGVSGFTGAFFCGAFFGEVWPDVFRAMTANEKPSINNRLHKADIIQILLDGTTL
jgi:fucose permease